MKEVKFLKHQKKTKNSVFCKAEVSQKNASPEYCQLSKTTLFFVSFSDLVFLPPHL